MLFIPSPPAHGFGPVGVAAAIYLGVVLGGSYGLWVLGAPDLLVVGGAIAVAVALFRPFIAVSRRLAPDPPDVE